MNKITVGIDHQTAEIYDQLLSSGVLDDFYLAGGTALALQLHHRLSIDLDFFTAGEFDTAILEKKLAKLGALKIDLLEADTLVGSLDGVKISFFHHPYQLLGDLIDQDGHLLAAPLDIAAMKISAIIQRGSKKDFVDLYFLLQKFSLAEIMVATDTKFGGKYNQMLILKSLIYFTDADLEPDPVMIAKVSWSKIKEELTAQAKSFLQKQLD